MFMEWKRKRRLPASSGLLKIELTEKKKKIASQVWFVEN